MVYSLLMTDFKQRDSGVTKVLESPNGMRHNCESCATNVVLKVWGWEKQLIGDVVPELFNLQTRVLITLLYKVNLQIL